MECHFCSTLIKKHGPRCHKCKHHICSQCIAIKDYVINQYLCNKCYEYKCNICHILIDIDHDAKKCHKCKHYICLQCIGITGCQTGWCLCNVCYDYKCKKCEGDLLPGTYLEDVYEMEDICAKCKKKSKNRK